MWIREEIGPRQSAYAGKNRNAHDRRNADRVISEIQTSCEAPGCTTSACHADVPEALIGRTFPTIRWARRELSRTASDGRRTARLLRGARASKSLCSRSPAWPKAIQLDGIRPHPWRGPYISPASGSGKTVGR